MSRPNIRMKDYASSLALWSGVLVPIVYFGVQLIAAQFYPSYSFITQSASELGSDRSNRPWILNTGAIVTGVLTLIAAFAIPSALRRRNCPAILVWATTLAMVSMAAGAIWAGMFPLPDARHNSGVLGAGAFLLPILFAIAIWRSPATAALKIYLVANVGLFVLMIAIMSGRTVIPVADVRGVLQRVAAAVLYLPIGVVSASLARTRIPLKQEYSNSCAQPTS